MSHVHAKSEEVLAVIHLLSSGRFAQLVLLCVFIISALFFTSRQAKTGDARIRPLPAVQALTEAVGRATEVGRPVHFTFGSGELDAQAFAGFSILSEVAGLCARYNCRLIVSNALAAVHPATEEIVKQAYVNAGNREGYIPGNIRYLGSGSYNAAVIGTIERERVAASVLVGSLFYESVLFIEAAERVGAVQIGGTMNTHQLPFIAAGCDYSLIGAEMYAASAYLSKDPIQVGWLMSEEACKVFALAAMGAGAALASLGIDSLAKILRF